MKNMLFQLIYITGFSLWCFFVSVCLQGAPCLSREQLLFGSSFKYTTYTFLEPCKFVYTHQELNDLSAKLGILK